MTWARRDETMRQLPGSPTSVCQRNKICGTNTNCQTWLVSPIDEVHLVLPLNLHAPHDLISDTLKLHFTMVCARRCRQ